MMMTQHLYRTFQDLRYAQSARLKLCELYETANGYFEYPPASSE